MNHNQPKPTHLPQQNLKPKKSSQDRLAEVMELQILTIKELDAIAGAGIQINHNETLVGFSKKSQKTKPSSEAQSTKNKELQKLTISELDAIAGGTSNQDDGLSGNHNETVVRFPHLSQKQKTSSKCCK